MKKLWAGILLLMICGIPSSSQVALNGYVVSANAAWEDQDLQANTFYVQKPDRSRAIQVRYQGSFLPPEVFRGDIVNLMGWRMFDSQTQETYFRILSVPVVTGHVAEPKPVSMTTRAVSGSSIPVIGEAPYTGASKPAPFGPYNVGLLVKIAGKVTQVNDYNQFFYVDDGCRLDDGYGPFGVRVSYNYTETQDKNDYITPPRVNQYVTVTGISSIEVWLDETIRCIKLRGPGDLAVHN